MAFRDKHQPWHDKVEQELLKSVEKGEDKVHHIYFKLKSARPKWEPHMDMKYTWLAPILYEGFIHTNQIEMLATKDEIHRIQTGYKRC